MSKNLLFKNEEVITKPFEGQKPGTSGLRKKTVVFQQKHYLENFVQSSIETICEIPFPKGFNPTIVIGGDGRFYNNTAINVILNLIFGNLRNFISSSETNNLKILIGNNGILSTPAISSIIRKEKCGFGGFILTASHNPGGPKNDYGIKYNSYNGGPANEKITNKIFEKTKTIKNYYKFKEFEKMFYNEEILTSGEKESTKVYEKKERKFEFLVSEKKITVEVNVIDSTKIYFEKMKTIFDFKMIKDFIKNTPNFKIIVDSMSGVMGPYSEYLFYKILEMEQNQNVNLLNSKPTPDFSGKHPDPNLTYAKELVNLINSKESNYCFGAAFDGDGDRNMILGKNFFVTPSDSVAIIADYAPLCIPFFKKENDGLKGFARSMPTSTAIDRVAKYYKIPIFEVPTGWKFFGNLMDAESLSICGEESFGTSSCHIREKDGLWAVLAWLSIFAYEKTTDIKKIVVKFWEKYGRSFYNRFDFENVESDKAMKMYKKIRERINYEFKKGDKIGKFVIEKADEFNYEDPIDKSISKNQGLRITFQDGSRLVYRLSGTGSVGATIRIYLERYYKNSKENEKIIQNVDSIKEVMKDLINVSLEISKIEEFTGRKEPTVIT